MKSGAFRIAVIYLTISILWIIISDQLLFIFQEHLSSSVYLFLNSIKDVLSIIVAGVSIIKLISLNDKELISSEKQYRLLFEDNVMPMWIYDQVTLKFISVNNAAIQKYGYSKEEFSKMTLLDIRPVEDIERMIDDTRKATIKVRQSGVWVHIKADGTQIMVAISSQAISFENKSHVMVTAQDVTEKVIYEQKLQSLNNDLAEEKAKLSETQKIAKIGGWEFYPENKQLFWSDEVYAITMTQPDTDVNLYELYFNHLHPDDHALAINALELLLSTGEPMDFVHRYNLPDGRLRYVRQLAKLEHKSGTPCRVIGSMQDITELKLLELEKNKYLVSLEDTLSSINEGFYALNKDLVFTKVNKKFELETGMSNIYIVGKELKTAFPGIEERITYEQYEKVLRERVPVKFEAYWQYINKWHDVAAYPTEDGIVVYYNDISERKERDLQLKHALERYNIVAKATQDVIYEYDVEQGTVCYNTSLAHLIQDTTGGIGNNIEDWRSLIHPEDVQAVVQTQKQIIQQGDTNWGCEYRINCGEGTYKYIFDQGYFMYNEDGKPVKLIGAVKDIDAIKRANEENRRLAEIITKVNNMIVVTDTNQRITWVNKAFEDYTGYKFEQVVGHEPKLFLGGDKIPAKTIEYIVERRKKLETFTLDIMHHLKTGTTQWVNIEYTPLFNNCGMHTGYIAVHKNITERKEKEERIKQQNKMLQEIAWLSSHEIRKPVASILGLSNLINEVQTVEEKEEVIQLVQQCAQDLDQVVHHITNEVISKAYVDRVDS
ncbi:PAS domain S-box protein [Mucilaginibacter robiniae]|uniref:histidine kinase n=1 Tax=Mucilaginibacter robiniae TaxID=2728022 RepID=A0A7L5E763_9SPHI|nr:PAS domain S-box protein [Mucilaginibacter robiniae]QJD97634.1 PAS domain S-box protein [Mucilaginibacter robiniae]